MLKGCLISHTCSVYGTEAIHQCRPNLKPQCDISMMLPNVLFCVMAAFSCIRCLSSLNSHCHLLAYQSCYVMDECFLCYLISLCYVNHQYYCTVVTFCLIAALPALMPVLLAQCNSVIYCW